MARRPDERGSGRRDLAAREPRRSDTLDGRRPGARAAHRGGLALPRILCATDSGSSRDRSDLMSPNPTATLCEFLAGFRWADVPSAVVENAKELFLDWFGSALAGKDSRPVRAFQAFARQAGPPGGPSEVLVDRSGTSPYFAALVNGASSHVVEQDDVHNGSVFHPGTVVFPAVLALAQALGASGAQLLGARGGGWGVGARV